MVLIFHNMALIAGLDP